MLHYALLLVVLACSFSGLTIGGKHFKEKCDRLLPDNRVGRQDYLDKYCRLPMFQMISFMNNIRLSTVWTLSVLIWFRTVGKGYQQIATGEKFLVIYSANSDVPIYGNYSKMKRIFKDTGAYDSIARYPDFNDECAQRIVGDFTTTTVTELRKEGLCKRKDTYLRIGKDGKRLQARFFSQDLSKYFWFFECYQRDANADSFQSCTGCQRLFELHIKDNRTPPTLDAELDLNGIPWGLVSQDFTDFTGLEFDDPKVKFFWTGEECAFFDPRATNITRPLDSCPDQV